MSAGDVWFVYLARCADDSLYTGIARDVASRIEQHGAGKGARYTRGRGPIELYARRRCSSKHEALVLEAAVKRLSHAQKQMLDNSRFFGAFARSVKAARVAKASC
ncbi:MAG: GIY-YIG nuclease family protein [Polyangiaceae bacterium]|nr:GIY-YIG nuclease family protein [Polyangiaceae bacterium]